MNARAKQFWLWSKLTVAPLLLVCTLSADIALRSVDQHLSGNLAHIQSIPEIVRHATTAGKPALLVIGNSLTNNGVAAEGIGEALPAFSVAKVTPDGSNLWDWQCIVKHQVLRDDAGGFQAVVVGYAWSLLSDQTAPNASRLGGLFCEWGDLRRPAELGITHSADIGEFIAARTSRIYALRETLRNRFFKLAIPHYAEYTQAANRAGQAETPVAVEDKRYTYDNLASLARQLQAKGTRLIVVAMPIQNQYSIDSELQSLADQGLLAIYDFRNVDEIDLADFEDSMHLNKQGQTALTARLAGKLATDIKAGT